MDNDGVDLRDLLDELVNQSLFYIGKIEFANRLLLPTSSVKDREFAMLKKQELLMGLDEVRHCFAAILTNSD